MSFESANGGKTSLAKITTTRKTSGFVLILALVGLALMTILLLALLEGASQQARGSFSDASFAREKLLADSAVALVMGQIQQASTQPGQTWISQPGLLRTYDATASRRPTACYKLYSTTQTTQLIDTSGTLGFLADDIPSDWNSAARKSFYTDLNAPQQTPGLLGRTLYPILDPAAVGTVQGVSYDAGHSVEMPVAWLYQLQDGTLGPASNGTKTNPIVARLAFWTDDETSKININTAGYGSPWNTPHANSTDDVAWSTTQPASGEFSRYPGHPAMTSLAVVFGSADDPHWPEKLLGLTPRYGFGGSEFGAKSTKPGETVPAKTDRLYASLDELCFSSSQSGSELRQPNPVTPEQIDHARFVLTAHSRAPETTLLGEPRVAIWPVSDAPKDPARTTPTDQAVASDATVGVRSYFFQRHNALSATDDLDPKVVPSNAQLFDELIARGKVNLPGCGVNFTQKYPGANWTQIMLEITDFIRGLNSVDPTPAPFVPYAPGGFIVPLTTAYGSGTSQITLRGMGRCPTLSSLTLVFYVCGFEFNNNPKDIIDYDATPDDLAGTSWKTNFDPNSPTNRWKEVTHELVRAFIVPCTFQAGCAYPEVSDACDIQISGLNGLSVSSGSSTSDFGFASTTDSHLLSDALNVPQAERAWGGNEGPLAWRAAALDQMSGGSSASYAFAGKNYFPVSFTGPASGRNPKTAGPGTWPPTLSFTCNGPTALTVNIRDHGGKILQTLNVNLPSFNIHAPTINGECDHRDGATPDTSRSDWATNSAAQVSPSYYMCLRNRLLATQRSRSVFLQAGDVSRSIEAATDLRIIAALTHVPATFFSSTYLPAVPTPQNGSHAHNIRFADGTSVCFASGTTSLIKITYPIASSSMTATDWHDGSTVPYTWNTTPSCSAPTGTTFVSMKPLQNGAPAQNVVGDWDTGPGFSPDGAQINLPDSGTTLAPETAYFSLTNGQVGAATQRTPNALVPSPVIFGSLPAGINPAQPEQSQPWRTLLFCPYPVADAVHPGFATPPDHLLLDNFWMPVVEPYGISTCMTTDGKINLNDQIAPFTYLHRNTAWHALLHDLRIPAIPASMVSSYKSSGKTITSIWQTVDEDKTIEQIENRFAGTGTDAYLSESEICMVPLVPKNLTTSFDSFWNSFQGAGQLTGDNLRELPYAQLYSRLTTRSNSYTVHVRVQVLKKLSNDPNQGIWHEGTDLVLGDWRGSYEIERYLDPSAQAPAAGQPLGPYRYRIVSSRRFTP